MAFDYEYLEREHLDTDLLAGIESDVASEHDGSVVHVPSSVAGQLLGMLMDEVEVDIMNDRIDESTHEKFVLAYQLDNAVHDDWNGKWTDRD